MYRTSRAWIFIAAGFLLAGLGGFAWAQAGFPLGIDFSGSEAARKIALVALFATVLILYGVVDLRLSKRRNRRLQAAGKV